ncbi:MAG: hypothetical protein HN413_17050 [Chloroflexi bacterium]|jgi:hypothetical protein|nr:hypothetical protein [Chloroflexota bacterium]
MTTLISFSSSSGAQSRCDARCYEARHKNCACICGGRNHGAGLDQAIENTRELAEQMVEEYARLHNLDAGTIDTTVNKNVIYQLALPL